MNSHAQEALKHAHGALQSARTDTEGLSEAQREALSKADAELRAATEKLQTEELAETEWVQETLAEAEAEEQSHATTEHLSADMTDLEAKVAAARSEHDEAQQAALDAELEAVRKQLEAQKAGELRQQGYLESIGKMKDELAKMQQHIDTMEDIKHLRTKIGGHVHSISEEESLGKELGELQDLMKNLEVQSAAGEPVSTAAEDALREELRRLRKSIAESIQRQEEAMQASEPLPDFTPVGPPTVPEAAPGAVSGKDFTPLAHEDYQRHPIAPPQGSPGHGAAPVDVDTEMPYGELEPFGREDTAAELTEASIHESDRMVDQIEKAEVAEEKRSVFRALTRLRGAAITSYDGVARSQTGNIDEYNHLHKWRDAHPLHHLADEESDVGHWAFPDNAD